MNVSPEIDITARTACGEDRSGGHEGMTAVICCIMNRVRAAKIHFTRYGRPHPLFGNGTFADCCQRPEQFSSWNSNDPNRAVILALTDSDPSFEDALEIAGKAVSGALIDTTGGATYYYAKSLRVPAYWAKGKTPCADIGGQLFFNHIN